MKIKKKVKKISHIYKKRGSRILSDHSLSQLLEIASYKKRINDLTKNNRRLTSALQESLVEAASQSSLIKNYARDVNQVLFARLKLNEMVKNLAKFAADLEEVQNCLNIGLPSEYNFFQKKKPSNERIIKIPDVSVIAEEPELSKNETMICENSPDDISLSTSEENLASLNHDIESTPILFVTDDQENKRKTRSSSINKGSLTPQLNIDFTYVSQRRSTRSRGKTPSFGKKSSGRAASQINTASSPLAYQVQDHTELNKEILKSPSDIKNNKKESENIKIPFEDQSDKSIVIGNDCSMIQPADLLKNDNKPVSNIELNQLAEVEKEVCSLEPRMAKNSLTYVTDLKDYVKIPSNNDEKNVNCVTDRLYPENDLQKLINTSQNASSILTEARLSEIFEFDKEIQNVGSLTFCDSDDDHDNEKKNTISPRSRSSRLKKPVKYSDYFLSDESDSESPFKLSVVKRRRSGSGKIKLNSTPNRKSCGKEIDENAGEFSSNTVKEVTEADFSVYNLDVSNSKKEKKKYRKNTSQKSKNIKVNDMPKPLYQKYCVTKFKPGKLKFSKFEISLEQNSVNTLSEDPQQNPCASPGGILKKPRPSVLMNEDKVNETRNADHILDIKQQNMFQTPKRVSFAPTDLVCKFEKMSESKAVANNRKVRRTSKSAVDLKDLFNEADSPKTNFTAIENLSNKTDTQKSDNTILFDFTAETEIYTLQFPMNAQFPVMPADDSTFSELCANKSPVRTKLINSKNDKLIDESFQMQSQFPDLPSDETISVVTSASVISEQMKLSKIETNKNLEKSPSTSVQCPVSPSPGNASLKISSSIISEQVKNDKCVKKSIRASNSPENINKLTEKENDPSHEALSQLNLEKSEKLSDILLLESPVSLVKRPKRKSLFKESIDDELKENICSDYPVREQTHSVKDINYSNKNSSITPTVDKKKVSHSRSQKKMLKTSAKKNKISNPDMKSLEQSPVLTDVLNVIASADENCSRRRSKQVSYKEPSLNKKLRRA